jgi:hypothetical protein
LNVAEPTGKIKYGSREGGSILKRFLPVPQGTHVDTGMVLLIGSVREADLAERVVAASESLHIAFQGSLG